jgi:hypothetical protein
MLLFSSVPPDRGAARARERNPIARVPIEGKKAHPFPEVGLFN